MIAAVVRELMAAGLTGEALVEAIERIEAAQAPVRSSAAERQKRYRERQKSVTRDVTRNEVTQKVSPTPPSKNNPPSAPKGASVPPPGEAEALARCLAEWNAVADRCGLPKAKSLTDTRRRQLRARLKAHGEPGFRQAVAAVERSAFCRGLRTARDGRTFKADFDFVVQERSFTKLLEGAYGDDAPREKPPPGPMTPDFRAHCERHYAATGEWLGDPAEKPKLAA